MDDLLKTLSGLYMQNYKDQTNNSKSFKDMLKERRQFVQSSENQFGDFTQKQLGEGVPVSPAEMDKPVLDYHTDNANATNELVNQGFRMDAQALDSLKALTDLFTSQQNTASANARADREYDLNKKKLYLDYGLDENGNADSGYVNTAAQNIMRGQQKLEDLPKNLQIPVAKKLHDMGFDPINTDRKQILDVVSELIGSDTKPITGILQIGPHIPGTKAQKTAALFDQLQSLLSLQNRDKLKGSGAISDFESKILAKAASSLNRNMSDEDFRKTLADVQTAFNGGMPVNNGGSSQDLVNKYWGN